MYNKRSGLAGILSVALIATVSCLHAANAQNTAEPIWPTKEWQTSTPEEQGMDSAALAKLVAYGTTRSLDSLLLVRHGRIVLDAYYAPYDADIPHVINSSTKVVIGTLTAMVYKDGLLDRLDHPLLDFFADRTVANLDDRKKAITVQNVLDMTSGFDWDEGFEGGPEQSIRDLGRSRDWVQFILDRPMAHPPGETFYYNSGNPHLLSAVITKLTGSTTQAFANARLFGPLGIAPPFWRRDPQGIMTGGFGLSLHARDMAKIGYLYLHNGKWEDKQLLPTDWVEKVSHATVDMKATFDPGLRYSNFFWVLPDKHIYMTVGYHCQVIMVLPDLDVVAVTTARDFCQFRKMADLISGAVKSDTALPANPAGFNLLADAVATISTEKPTEVGATPDTATAISGKLYKFSDNAFDIKSLSLTLADPKPRYELQIDTHNPAQPSVKLAGPIGLDGRYGKAKRTDFGVRAVKGRWLDEHRFDVDIQYVGAGEQRKWLLTFEGDKVNVRGKDRQGHEVSIDGEAGG